jgi:type IV secretion system pilin
MRRTFVLALGAAVVLLLTTAPVALAAPNDLGHVIDNLRVWLTGLLAGLATLLLTIGGIRYLLAGGDPGSIERAKGAVKAALAGYALAVLAPVLIGIVRQAVGS